MEVDADAFKIMLLRARVHPELEAAALRFVEEYEAAKQTQQPDDLGELRPCPFCGCEAEYSQGFGRNYAQCKNGQCWMQGIMASPAEWNTRQKRESVSPVTPPRDCCLMCEKQRIDAEKALSQFPVRLMVVCPKCGFKRCPKATNHENACTGSNKPGQPGSAYQSNEIEDGESR